MRGDISTKAAAGSADPITRPIFLVSFAFPSVLRLCSRGNVVFQGQTFVNAALEYDGASVSVLNENLQFTAPFMSNRGRVTISVWGSYGEAPFVDADWYEEFVGEVGTRDFGDWISCDLKQFGAQPQPHYYVGRPVFNHLIRAGSRLEFPTGSYEI